MSELYQLPDGWQWRELKTVCTFINGRAYKQAELLSDGKYPVLRVGNFFTNNSWYYSDLELPRDKYCEQGDLLYAWSASFGPKIWDGIKSIFHYHIWKIEPDYSAVTKLYLYWLLYWDVNQIKADFGSGTTMIHVTKGAIESRKVPLPPIPEQKRIVQKLDALFERIDKAIALLQKNIDAADNFMNSVLDDVFSDLEQHDPIVKISDIAYIKGGKRLPKGEKLSETKTEYPYIRVADFLDIGTISLEKMLYITEDIHKQIKNYIITSSDLYISIAGTIGKTGIIPDILNGANLTENAARLVYKCSNVLNRYIYFLTNSMKFKEQIGLATKTVAQPKLALSRLSEVELPLPMLYIQHKVVSYLDSVSIQIEQVKLAQQQKMQSLLGLKSSILDQAFHGKL